MFAKINRKIVVVVAIVAAAIIGAGSAYAATADAGPGSAQTVIFGCQTSTGQLDYYQFRTPLPHKCTTPGDSLVEYPAMELTYGTSFPMSWTISAPSGPNGSMQAQTVSGQCTVQAMPGPYGSRLGLTCVTTPSSSSSTP